MWVDDDESFMISSPLIANFEDMVVRDIYYPNTQEWDVELIREAFSEGECSRILKTILGPKGTPDRQI